MTENKMERRVPTRLEKYLTVNRRGEEQGDSWWLCGNCGDV